MALPELLSEVDFVTLEVSLTCEQCVGFSTVDLLHVEYLARHLRTAN